MGCAASKTPSASSQRAAVTRELSLPEFERPKNLQVDHIPDAARKVEILKPNDGCAVSIGSSSSGSKSPKQQQSPTATKRQSPILAVSPVSSVPAQSPSPVAVVSPVSATTQRQSRRVVFASASSSKEEDAVLDVGLVVIIEEKLEDKYDVDKTKRLGKGHYASVYAARNKQTKERVAVKFIEKRLSKDERLKLEVDVMRRAGTHPHIVQLLDVFETETQVQLVLEFLEGGELFEHLVHHGPYSELDAARHIRDVTSAIAFLHSENIIHRDLKPENLLLTSKRDEARVKVADFGLAKLMKDDVTRTVCGTWAYCAPEVKRPQGSYDNQCDAWSIGVIAFILLSAFHPFDSNGDSADDEIWARISAADYDFEDPAWDSISNEAKDFVAKLLVLDPNTRMSAAEALGHPWLRDLSDVPVLIPRAPISPSITEKLATFQVRTKTAMNPLQKAALKMRQRVGGLSGSPFKSQVSPPSKAAAAATASSPSSSSSSSSPLKMSLLQQSVLTEEKSNSPLPSPCHQQQNINALPISLMVNNSTSGETILAEFAGEDVASDVLAKVSTTTVASISDDQMHAQMSREMTEDTISSAQIDAMMDETVGDGVIHGDVAETKEDDGRSTPNLRLAKEDTVDAPVEIPMDAPAQAIVGQN